MGIPVYFKTLIDNYNDICISCNNKLQINTLFFDLNCLIHPCCRNETDESIMNKNIFTSILSITDIVNPNNIYIAIDGPCPRPKMQQQRLRRFKSSKETKCWDTNSITPGTKFMEKLEIYLVDQLKKTKLKYIFDSSNNPGEGEHKIFNYIKENNVQSSMIYGLDADLIMLGLLSPCKKCYLIRERTEYNIEDIDSEFIYLNIQNLKKKIIESIKKNIFKISDQQLLYDYIFICFFLGNDFVQHTPSINIRYNGIEELLIVYKELHELFEGNFYITDLNTNDLVHKDNLLLFLKYLAKNEDKRIEHILSIRKRQEKKYKNIFNKTNDIKQFEELVNHKPILDRKNEIQIFNNMKYWKTNYYMYHFFYDDYNPSYDELLQQKTEELCKYYLESLYWTIQYYIKGCISWRWYNPYYFAPSLIDVCDYLKNNKIIIKKDNKPFKPEEQLLLVLPPSSFNLINNPPKLPHYFYPKDFKESYVLKRYLWESYPIIPS